MNGLLVFLMQLVHGFQSVIFLLRYLSSSDVWFFWPMNSYFHGGTGYLASWYLQAMAKGQPIIWVNSKVRGKQWKVLPTCKSLSKTPTKSCAGQDGEIVTCWLCPTGQVLGSSTLSCREKQHLGRQSPPATRLCREWGDCPKSSSLPCLQPPYTPGAPGLYLIYPYDPLQPQFVLVWACIPQEYPAFALARSPASVPAWGQFLYWLINSGLPDCPGNVNSDWKPREERWWLLILWRHRYILFSFVLFF